MAIPAIATFLFPLSPLHASDVPISATTDESGHKVYVNDTIAAAPEPTVRSEQKRLVFWSAGERSWKSVPQANVRAATSAAAEVDRYLGKSSPLQNSSAARGFTQRDVDAAIDQAAVRQDVDRNLVRALVRVESNFNPNAVSPKGAMGLMQLMPETARRLNVTNPFNPEENVDAGVRHLKKLLESFGGDVRLSLAAYNAGSAAVARNRGIPRYAETRNYVRRITDLYGGSVGTNYFAKERAEPVRVERDSRGVLYISNTD
ncbi:MAG: lytic transglycosylase domain-containing protein [Acidobacteria bacterium]|nr:lytic transglycosylase domain-containing protein [Acidobacteriota bacterium]